MSDTKKTAVKCTTLNCIKNEIRNDVSYFSETDTDYTYLSMNQCPGVRLLTELCSISH